MTVPMSACACELHEMTGDNSSSVELLVLLARPWPLSDGLHHQIFYAISGMTRGYTG